MREEGHRLSQAGRVALPTVTQSMLRATQPSLRGAPAAGRPVAARCGRRALRACEILPVSGIAARGKASRASITWRVFFQSAFRRFQSPFRRQLDRCLDPRSKAKYDRWQRIAEGGMKFGLFGGARAKGGPAGDSSAYHDFVNYVVEAEKLGFSSV